MKTIEIVEICLLAAMLIFSVTLVIILFHRTSKEYIYRKYLEMKYHIKISKVHFSNGYTALDNKNKKNYFFNLDDLEKNYREENDEIYKIINDIKPYPKKISDAYNFIKNELNKDNKKN